MQSPRTVLAVVLLVTATAFLALPGLPSRPANPLPPGAILRLSDGHIYRASRASFAADGRWVATAYSIDGQIRVWDARSGRLWRIVTPPKGVNSFSAGPHILEDGQRLLFDCGDIAGGDRSLVVLDAATGRTERTIRYHTEPPGPRPHIFYGPLHITDGRHVRMVRTSFVEGRERYGYISEVIGWDLAIGQAIPTVQLKAAKPALFNGVIDPTGRTIVDGKRVIDASTGRLIATLEGPADPNFQDPRFSADGRRVAMFVVEHSPTNRWTIKVLGVQVWETQTGRLIGRFPDMVGQYPNEPNRSYRLTPDGRHLVTVGPTGLAVREVTTGNLVLTHSRVPRDLWPNSLDISPDGRRVVIAGIRSSTLIWDLTVRK